MEWGILLTLNGSVDVALTAEVLGRLREELVEQLPLVDQLPLPQDLVAHLHDLPYCPKHTSISAEYMGMMKRRNVSPRY